MAAAAQRRAALDVNHGDDLLGMAYRLQREALELLERVKAEGNDYLQLQAMDRLQKGIALLATLGESPLPALPSGATGSGEVILMGRAQASPPGPPGCGDEVVAGGRFATSEKLPFDIPVAA